ncbi:MAG: hypothetical protein AMXMBFR47_04690 [Planctomycetota bacterium]
MLVAGRGDENPIPIGRYRDAIADLAIRTGVGRSESCLMYVRRETKEKRSAVSAKIRHIWGADEHLVTTCRNGPTPKLLLLGNAWQLRNLTGGGLCFRGSGKRAGQNGQQAEVKSH